MKLPYRLFSSDAEALGGNGPAVVTQSPVATAEAPAAPGFLQKAAAALSSKATLISERDSATLRSETAEALVATQSAELTVLRADLATFQAERVELEALIDSAAKEKQTVDAAAASQIAALGFSAQKLPAASADAAEDVPTLLAQMNSTTDEKEKYRLAAKINELEAGH
jgi:redox-regulated HSP33 family molecular chaperone